MEGSIVKIRVQKRIIIVSVVLLIGKFLAFFITNSVGILSDALESIVNVMAGLISLYSIRFAAKPRDTDHPFGHGKVELISASIEGMLIFAAGIAIVVEGIKRLFAPLLVLQLDIGIVIIAIAGLINYIMGYYSVRIGKKYDSAALIAGGRHLQSDTWSTLGLLAGLLLLFWTRIIWIDSVIAMVFGTVIIMTGINIMRKMVDNLMDKMDFDLLKTIMKELTLKRQDDWIDIYDVKILKNGNLYFVDCKLVLPWNYNMQKANASCSKLESVIKAKFADRIHMSVHTEPCTGKYCSGCVLSGCEFRLHSFENRRALTS